MTNQVPSSGSMPFLGLPEAQYPQQNPLIDGIPAPSIYQPAPPQQDLGVVSHLRFLLQRINAIDEACRVMARTNQVVSSNQISDLQASVRSMGEKVGEVENRNKNLQEQCDSNTARVVSLTQEQEQCKTQLAILLGSALGSLKATTRVAADVKKPSKTPSKDRLYGLRIFLALITLIALAAAIVFILCSFGCIPSLSALIMGSAIGTALGAQTLYVLATTCLGMSLLTSCGYFLTKKSC